MVTVGETFEGPGARARVLIDGVRRVSPRFVFKGYEDAVQGEFVRPYLGEDGLLEGRLAALLVETDERLVLVDTGMGLYGADVGAGRVLDIDEVTKLQRWATSDLRPHLTVVLDVEPDQGLGRLAERDRIEAEGHEFHKRARQAFLDLAAADPDHYLVLDGRSPVDDVAGAVRERVEPLLARASR